MATTNVAANAALPPTPSSNQPPEPRRACQECNRKKAKCDRRRPMCGLCLRTGTPCNFPSQRKRPSRRKPLLNHSRELNDRVSTLVQILTGEARSGEGHEASTSISDIPESSLRQFLQTLLENVDQPKNLSENVVNPPVNELQPNSHHIVNESIDQDLDDGDPEMEESNPRLQGNRESLSIPASNVDQLASPAIAKSRSETTSALAMQLIQLFFDNIQPWLPLLHKPRFLAWVEEKLSVEGDVLRGLNPDEALTICSMLALAARFSNHPRFANLPALEKGDEFAELAAQAYGKSRLSSNPPFAHIQGCILLAFYFYTSGPNKQGWILIGVCVRLAYIMGLSEIDDEEWVPPRPMDAVEKEELRRAWWLVWELDTFASMTFRKPFSIDRKRMAVKLPISDQAWFAEMEIDSAEMMTNSGQIWKSLQGSPNQDARSWFLLADQCMSNVLDRLQQRHGLTLEDKVILENEVACFKIALPPALRLDTEPLEFSPSTFATSNWILGIHLMLMATSFMISGAIEADQDGQSPASASASGSVNSTLPVRQRAITLSRILNQWDAKYIPVSHPFLSCLIVAPFIRDSDVYLANPLVASSHHLSKVVLSCFAEKWKIACVAQGLLDAGGKDNSTKGDEKKRAKGYAALFGFPPFSAANTPSVAGSNERGSPSYVKNGRHQSRNSSVSLRSHQQQHLLQPPSHLRSAEAPTCERSDVPNYRARPFELEGLPPIQFNIDGDIGDNSAFLDMFDGYQDTDFMQVYPWMNVTGPPH